MIDIKKIIQTPEAYKDAVAKRNSKNIDIDKLIECYQNRNKLMHESENIKAEINKISKSVGAMSDAEKKDVVTKGQQLKEQMKKVESGLSEMETAYNAMIMNVPNLLPDDTPLGLDDSENISIRKFGEPTRFAFTPKDHLELGRDLDLLDFESGAKTTGMKFFFLKNDAVILEHALKRFALEILREKGFYILKTPDLAKQEILIGSGFAPRGNESNVYNIEDMELSLIATAEITVGGMLSDTVFKGDVLPLFFVAESHCFRREAGSAGQESKGLYRVHQFDKMEMYAISDPEHSNEVLEKLVATEEEIYHKLNLPHQVVRICAGDLGAPAYKKYDIEAWMPFKNGYGEITSASNCDEFQARRLNIKYTTPDGKKEFAHTLNGTAIALTRVILAIMENYQNADGSITIPEVLRKYTGFDKIEKPLYKFDDFKVN